MTNKELWAVALVVELARLQGVDRKCVPKKDLVKALEIGIDYADPILRQLCSQGIVTATRGRVGGYQLPKGKDWSVLEIRWAINEAPANSSKFPKYLRGEIRRERLILEDYTSGILISGLSRKRVSELRQQ